MKRVGHLYEKMMDATMIDAAICEASRGKRDRYAVKRVLADKPRHIAQIQEMLTSDAVELSEYKVFTRRDHRAGKTRTIKRPKFFPDQVLHWLIIFVIKPVIMQSMDFWNCGSIPGRGIKRGHQAIRKWLKTDKPHTKYCLKMDVKKFYDSVPHNVLLELLNKKIKDPRLMALIKKVVGTTESGIPIGNYTSQWLANFFLCGLDHYIREELKACRYVRYIDDMVILGGNKKELHKTRRRIAAYLQEKLGLDLKENWQVFKVDSRGIDFLGYVFHRNHIRLRGRNFLALRRQAATVKRLIQNKSAIPPNIAAGMLSRMGQLKWFNSQTLRKKYLKGVKVKLLQKAVSNASKRKLQPVAV